MNVALAILGIMMMTLGGYTAGTQISLPFTTQLYSISEVSLLALAGLAINGLGFMSFMKSFPNIDFQDFFDRNFANLA